MSFTQSNLNAAQAAPGSGQITGLSGSTILSYATNAHFWTSGLFRHLATAARKYGPEILNDADAFFATDTGKRAAGWLEAHAEDAGIPPEFADHVGPEIRALLTKIDAWNAP
jgi:hypothetical protein